MKTTFRIVLILMIILFTFGCQNDAQAKLEAENIELVKKYFNAWNNLDIETIKTLYDENIYSFSRTFKNPEPKSYEETIETVLWNFEYFPDAKTEIINIVADGNMVVSMCLWEATYIKDIEDLPSAKGQSVNFSFVNTIWIENGKIVEEIEVANLLEFYNKIDMELKPKE